MTEEYGFFDMLRDTFFDRDEVSGGDDNEEKDECDKPDYEGFYDEVLDNEEGEDEEEELDSPFRIEFYGEVILDGDEEEEECGPPDGDESRDNDSDEQGDESDPSDGDEGMASLPASIP